MSGRQRRKTARAARTAAKVLPAGFAPVPDAPAQGWDSAATIEAPPLGDAFFAGRASCIQAGTPRPSRGRWKKAPRRETSRRRAELDWLHALSSLEEGREAGLKESLKKEPRIAQATSLAPDPAKRRILRAAPPSVPVQTIRARQRCGGAFYTLPRNLSRRCAPRLATGLRFLPGVPSCDIIPSIFT